MKISIGMLAYNEASGIRQTLESFLQQSIFRSSDRGLEIEIIAVPNGCRDHTAEIMRQTLGQIVNPTDYPGVTWQVHELTRPGKSNAWNHFVHEFSDPKADYFFLVDADILFPDHHTLLPLLELLEREPQVGVAVDQPIKDVVLKSRKNLIEHLSSFVSQLSGSSGAAWLCGQLYCARAALLRQIYIPAELPAQDAFLYEMLTTNCLTAPQRRDRIARVPDTLHIFEAYVHPQKLLKHERLMLVAKITNAVVFEHLRVALRQADDRRSAAALCREWDQQNPQWVKNLIRAKRRKQAGWFVPSAFWQRRFADLPNKSVLKQLFLFPLAMLATGVDLFVLYAANRELSKVD
jgi:glycosyltransferase involved in cell wall biosynthesis